MQIRPSQVIAAAAGVLAFDFFFCGMIAPKLFKALDLAVEKRQGCHCGGGCDSCAIDITSRLQVIDVTPVSVFDRLRLTGRVN